MRRKRGHERPRRDQYRKDEKTSQRESFQNRKEAGRISKYEKTA